MEEISSLQYLLTLTAPMYIKRAGPGAGAGAGEGEWEGAGVGERETGLNFSSGLSPVVVLG